MKKNRTAPPAPHSSPSSHRPLWPWLAACFGTIATVALAWGFLSTDSDRPWGPAPEGMVWIPGGEFWMGSEAFPDAQPVHRVHVDGFWMDRTEVTNAQFAQFVEATGYKTIAERTPVPEDFPPHIRPHLKPELMVAGSLVFTPPKECPAEDCSNCDQWWAHVPGACWKHPEGPGSTIEGKENHPVVHVAWEDAVAYAKWAGKRLPTEAEWERAARGGQNRKSFYWGEELTPGKKWMANIWQGKFPCENHAEDGYPGTAPVGSYPPNAYGLVDMSGNVWEWCADWYQPGYGVQPGERRRNPKGPDFSIDPHNNGEPKRVQRGGSFLCSDAFCARYRAGARGQGEPMTGQSHTGFRCVK